MSRNLETVCESAAAVEANTVDRIEQSRVRCRSEKDESTKSQSVSLIVFTPTRRVSISIAAHEKSICLRRVRIVLPQPSGTPVHMYNEWSRFTKQVPTIAVHDSIASTCNRWSGDLVTRILLGFSRKLRTSDRFPPPKCNCNCSGLHRLVPEPDHLGWRYAFRGDVPVPSNTYYLR